MVRPNALSFLPVVFPENLLPHIEGEEIINVRDKKDEHREIQTNAEWVRAPLGWSDKTQMNLILWLHNIKNLM